MDESLSQSAIHGSCLNFRMVTPVCPVHGTGEKHRVWTYNYKTFDNWKSCDRNLHIYVTVPLKPHTLSVDPLQLRKAHLSYQRSESCNVGLTSEPLLLHLDLSRSNTGYQPPSPPLYLEASSVLWSGNKQKAFIVQDVCVCAVFVVARWTVWGSAQCRHFTSITCRLVILPSLCRLLRWELELEEDDEDVDSPGSS